MEPAFHLAINNKALSPALRHRVLAIEVTDRDGFTSDSLRVKMDARDWNNVSPHIADNMDVALGYAGQTLQRIGLFQIDAFNVTGPPDTLTVEARGARFADSDSKNAKTRTWPADISLTDVARTIGKEHGLDEQAVVVAPCFDDVRFPNLQQDHENDWNFLARLAEAVDGTFKPANNQIILLAAGAGTDSMDEPRPTVTLKRGNLTDWDYRRDSLPEYGAVKARWWDLQAAKEQSVTIGDPNSGAILDLLHPLGDEAEAHRAAQTVLRRQQRAAGALRLRLPGAPYIKVTTPITLDSIHTSINGTGWVAKEVKHKLDKNGFTTDVLCEVRTA